MMQVLTTLNNEQEEGEEEMEEEGIYKDIQEAEEKLEVPKESYLEKIREPKGVTGTFPKEQTAQEILDEVVLKIEPNQIPIPEQGGKD